MKAGNLAVLLLVSVSLMAPPSNVFAESKKKAPKSSVKAAAPRAATKPPPVSAKTATKTESIGEFGMNEDQQKEFSKLPTYIKSDSLTLKSQERFFVYSGNVEVLHGDLALTADFLEGRYNDKNEIQQLLAKQNVVVTKGPTIRASGQRAVYEAATGTVTLTESPELLQGESVLTADAIKIFLQENRSVAEGAVRVKLVRKEGKEQPTSILNLR